MTERCDTVPFAKTIASHILSTRKRAKLTQAQVAARAKVRTATVWQAENDPSHMQLDTLGKIMGVLGITLSAQRV